MEDYYMNRTYLNNIIHERTQGVVQRGPFTGLKLCNYDSGCLGNKLLGSYESQLYPAIEQTINYKPDLIINLGCGEGYYGLGLAKRLPNVRNIIVDNAEHELINALYNLQANNLDNVELWNSADLEVTEFIMSKYNKPFLFVDVEGYEITFLDKKTNKELEKSYIIVECHDFQGTPITQILQERFINSHHIFNIYDELNKTSDHQSIQSLTKEEKDLLLSEGRPGVMNWLYMIPKTFTI